MATLGRWTGGAVSGSPTTSWSAPANIFTTEQRNDGSTYSFISSVSTIGLPLTNLADGYIFIAHVETVGGNNRTTPGCRIIQAGGTGNFASGNGQGYQRSTSNNNTYLTCWGFVDNPSANASFQFQWIRDTDNQITGTVRATFEVIPIFYSDVGIFTSTSVVNTGGTTPSQLTGFTGTNGTNITLSSNVVTVSGDNKRYLCLGGYFLLTNATARTQRWAGFRIDGVKDDSMKGYAYIRNSGNQYCGINWIGLIETSTANRTIDMFRYRGDGVASDQGGADVDSGTGGTGGSHSMVIIELNDSAEGLWSTNTGGTQQNIHSTTNSNLQVANTVEFNDSASFTKTSDTQVNAEADMDALVFSNISAASFNVGSGTRGEFFTEVTVNDVEDEDIFDGNYIRGNQGSQDTFGWAANPKGYVALTTGDDVGVSVSESGDSHNTRTQLGWTGFGILNLDTLEGGAPPSTRRLYIIS